MLTIMYLYIDTEPVSYTHLDVYKRQNIHCTEVTVNGNHTRKPNGRGKILTHGCKVGKKYKNLGK